ncbi:hypothetical protein C8J56DRAFT_1051187 [Mycena floridula]|nr:hypothetical protein C8J56DRAFT_1051187 [Mycena floridula]
MSGAIRKKPKTNSGTIAGKRYKSGGHTGRLGHAIQTLTRSQVLATKVKDGFSAVPAGQQPATQASDNDGYQDIDMEEAVVEGQRAVPISHEGGEWGEIEEIWASFRRSETNKIKYREKRAKRRDHTQ